MAGVLGVFRRQPAVIEQFQGLKHGTGLPAWRLQQAAGNGAQGVLRGLGAIASSDEQRKLGVIRRLVGEARLQTDAGNRVHQIAQVDPLIPWRAGDLADRRMPLCPVKHFLSRALIAHLENLPPALMEPLHQPV